MTIIPFAAARCIDCKAPVAIVRRTVEVPCAGCPAADTLDHGRCPTGQHDHTHPIPDVGPVTVVDEDGIRHECATLTGVA